MRNLINNCNLGVFFSNNDYICISDSDKQSLKEA